MAHTASGIPTPAVKNLSRRPIAMVESVLCVDFTNNHCPALLAFAGTSTVNQLRQGFSLMGISFKIRGRINAHDICQNVLVRPGHHVIHFSLAIARQSHHALSPIHTLANCHFPAIWPGSRSRQRILLTACCFNEAVPVEMRRNPSRATACYNMQVCSSHVPATAL